MSARTCALILEELEFALWRPSTVVVCNYEGELESKCRWIRTSESTDERWFSSRLRRAVDRIEWRLTGWLGCARERYEPWQATRYHPGTKFDFHLDCGFWGATPEGEREKTVLVYLDTPGRGGSTRFKELGLDIAARAGRILVWNNLASDGSCDPEMLHASTPVARGLKTTLVTWIRQRSLATRYREEENHARKETDRADHFAVRTGDRPSEKP